MEKQEMYYGYIYLTLDQKNNKVYVGQCSHKPEDSKDYYGSGKIIKSIIKKRGTYFLKKIILGELFAKTKKELKELLNKSEIICIFFYDSCNEIYGYNISLGGSNFMLGVRHSEETKKKISEATIGRVVSKEAREKMSKANKGEKNSMYGVHRIGENSPNFGKPHSKEAKEKISKANRGKKVSKETREKIRLANLGEKNGMYGKIHTFEAKEKIGDAHRGKIMSEESKEKNRQFHLGVVFTEEHKKKMSESAKNLPEVTCPYCNKSGKGNGMKQWHFDNCKFKNNEKLF